MGNDLSSAVIIQLQLKLFQIMRLCFYKFLLYFILSEYFVGEIFKKKTTFITYNTYGLISW